MAERQGNRDIWETALADYRPSAASSAGDLVPAAGAATAGYLAGRYLRKRRLGKKIDTKVVSIKPKRELVPRRGGGGNFGRREVKYYVDKEGRRYQPAVYNQQTGTYEVSRWAGGRQYMMREDGVIFKIRRDGKYVMTVPQRSAGARRRKRRK